MTVEYVPALQGLHVDEAGAPLTYRISVQHEKIPFLYHYQMKT